MPEVEVPEVEAPVVEVPALDRLAVDESADRAPAEHGQIDQSPSDAAAWDEAWLPQWVDVAPVAVPARPSADAFPEPAMAPGPPLLPDRQHLVPGASAELVAALAELEEAERSAERERQAQLAAWAADIQAAEALPAPTDAGARGTVPGGALPAVRTPPTAAGRRRYRVLLPAAVLVVAGVVAGFTLPGGSDGAGPSIAAVQRDTDERAAPTTANRSPATRVNGLAALGAGAGDVDPPVATAPTGSPSAAATPGPRAASVPVATSSARGRTFRVVAPRSGVQPGGPAGSAVQAVTPLPGPPALPAPIVPAPMVPAPIGPGPIEPAPIDPVGNPTAPDGDCPATVPEDGQTPDEGTDPDVPVDAPVLGPACAPVDPDPREPDPEGTDPGGEPEAPAGPGDGSSGDGEVVPPVVDPGPPPAPSPTATPTETSPPTTTPPTPTTTPSTTTPSTTTPSTTTPPTPTPSGAPDPSATLAEARGRS
ncbi:hypothetical protein O2V63_16785 [Modestobacter sp. VKM Ac-2977]|uniref:hypothetical protein n=1 Tax=Modestobacter sp. VKM Ac-2977 TaxID=3004131 RepID=UPI0022AB1600|nr:hypothetical protein [Modestobacter sp. VKM Ac-2977]MCZ2821999.1 hypothetical protein [Modestobacter sp. VKM Ac-2977]